MRIKQVNIEKVMQFDSLECNFNDGLNIIVGQNGAGKTNLMKLLYFALYEESNPFFKNNFTRNINAKIEVMISFDDSDVDAFLHIVAINYIQKINNNIKGVTSEKLVEYVFDLIKNEVILSNDVNYPKEKYILTIKKTIKTDSKQNVCSMYELRINNKIIASPDNYGHVSLHDYAKLNEEIYNKYKQSTDNEEYVSNSFYHDKSIEELEIIVGKKIVNKILKINSEYPNLIYSERNMFQLYLITHPVYKKW